MMGLHASTMKKFPRSAYDKVGGIVYFARMLDKIRLMAAGDLPPEYHKNLSGGFDGRCCRFLGVQYEGVKQRTLAGGSDDEVLGWCLENGRKPNEEEILVWNAFMTKRGWKDEGTEALNRFKAESGFAGRDEIETMFSYYEYDEGRAK
jgi:gluconokinase